MSGERVGKGERQCLDCLRIPCMCQEHPGMKIDDETLIDFAAHASNRGLALHAEVVLRKRWPSRAALAALEREPK